MPNPLPSSPPARAGLITAVLALLSAFPPVATDMYLSAMDDLSHALNASDAATEMSLSLFFLGLCVGQLIMGPLIDGFGRKGPLLAGVALFTVTSILLLLTRDVVLFNTLRFFQAIGACAGMVVGRAVVNDLYKGREAARVLTLLVMLMTLGPILSPFLGSLMLTAFGWESIFGLMVALGVLAFLLARFILPETLPVDARAPRPARRALAVARDLLTRRGFILPALTAALVQAAMFAFITGSSGLFQGGFGLSSTGYGLFFALIATALLLAGKLNTRLLDRHAPAAIVGLALPLFALAGGALVLLSGISLLWVFAVPLWLAIGLVGLLSANLMAIAMEASTEGAGVGSALLGGIQFSVAFLCSAGVALGGSSNGLAMALGIFLPGLMALGIWTCHCRAAASPARG
ncbi:multidrug effflux MFS transporter [Marinibacterium sp. SX1]|uniref:multidrug effflux MFS transporter n=1 Tax=Marinibacterium sp. SX1 TaxID=3388424 RepID=UPI003D16D8CE